MNPPSNHKDLPFEDLRSLGWDSLKFPEGVSEITPGGKNPGRNTQIILFPHSDKAQVKYGVAGIAPGATKTPECLLTDRLDLPQEVCVIDVPYHTPLHFTGVTVLTSDLWQKIHANQNLHHSYDFFTRDSFTKLQ